MIGKYKRGAEKALREFGRGVGAKVRKTVKSRAKAQENFRNRPNNKNYYGSWKDFR